MPSPTVTASMIENARTNITEDGLVANRFVYFDDFIEGGYNPEDSSGKFSETAGDSPWLVLKVDAATDNNEVIAISDTAVGGVLTLTTTNADNDGLSLQLEGNSFAVTANKNITYECRFRVTNVEECDWFVGLATTDVTGTTPVLAGVNDSIGFRCPDSTGDIDYVVEDDTSETTADSTKDLANATFVVVRFEVKGTTSVQFWIDGVAIATVTTNLPDTDAMLTPTLEIRNDGAAANTIEIDYLLVAQDR